MMKKFLMALMLMVLLPLSALAEITLAGTDLSEGGWWRTDGTATVTPASEEDWHVHYDAETRTLTLRGANVIAPQDVNGLVCDHPLSIVLAEGTASSIASGDMTQPAEGSGDTWEEADGVLVYGSLDISGEGTLRAVGGDGGSSKGIMLNGNTGNGADLTITGVTVEAVAGQAAAFSVAVHAHGKTTLTNASLTAESGEATVLYSYGLWSPVTAVNSALSVTAGKGARHSLGVYGAMDLTDTQTLVRADLSSSLSQALSGGLTMQGGEAEFIGGSEALKLSAAPALSDDLTVTGAAAPDGTPGEVTWSADSKQYFADGEKARHIVIKPEEQEDVPPAPTATPEPPAPPATGDGAQPAMWLMLLALCGGALLAAKKRFN